MYIKRVLILAIVLSLSFMANAQRYSTYELSLLQFVAGGGSSSTSLEDLATAQNELAIRYFEGSGGASKNYEKAVYWYTKSANNGNKWAQINLAYAYLNGNGVTVDKSKALYWFEQSGNQHFHKAALMAGKMYLVGDGTSINYDKAAHLFKDAAFGGEPEGMYYYATCFAEGLGVKADSTKAILWANRALDKEYYWTYWLLGRMYEKGLSVKADNWSAKYYYSLGDEHDISACQNDLGVAYATGSFVEKDMDKALELYLKAANNGNTVAMSNLAFRYSDSNDQHYNLTQAAFWYKKMIDAGDTDKIWKLISIDKKLGNYSEVKELYEKLASQGDPDGYNGLAYLYAEGQGVTIDFTKSISLIDSAIKLAPEDMGYQDSKGEILLMKGDVKKAEKIWKYINEEQPLYYQNWIQEYGEETPFYTYMKTHSL